MNNYIPIKQEKNRVLILQNFKMVNKLLRNGFIKAKEADSHIKNNIISQTEYSENVEEMKRMQKLIIYMKRLTSIRNSQLMERPPL